MNSAGVQQARAMLWNKDDSRGQYLRLYFWRAAPRFLSGIEREHDGMRFFVSTQDQAVGYTTFIVGSFELDIMRESLALATDILGTDPVKGKVFVDVGANIGTTSVPAAKIFGASGVVAIEPGPENFAILQFNVARNGLSGVVSCVHAAATDVAGTVELELCATNTGDHRVRIGDDPVVADYEASRAVVRVPGRRLDEILDAQGIDINSVGLFWVDTQGHEAHVLASAADLLARSTIPFIMEYWPFGLRLSHSLDQLHQLIGTYFREAWDIRAKPAPVRYAAADVAQLAGNYPGETYTDLLLVP